MSSFLTNSKTIVTDFLQNVIIIDDEAYLQNVNSTPKMEEVNTPVGRGMKADFSPVNTVEHIPVVKIEEKTKEITDVKDHIIDIKVLTDHFASHGLLCSILRPEEQEVDFVEKTKKVLKKADIIILDWNIKIEGKAGDETVKELIEAIVKDENSHQQKSMRYIAIYSGEDNLDLKLKEIKHRLDQLNGLSGKIIDIYKLIYDHLQISIYAKESQKSNTDPDIKTSEDKLADKIITDFTSLVHGIVPNIALSSLANIRKNTHRVLTKFSANIDDAFLAHRAMLPEPRDAELLLVDILTDEIQSILDDQKIELDSKLLNDWIDDRFDTLGQAKLYESYKDCYLNKDNYDNKDEFVKTLSFCEKSMEKLDDIYNDVKDDFIQFMKPNKEHFSSQLKQDIHDCIIIGIENLQSKQSIAVKGDSPKFFKVLNRHEQTNILNDFAILTTNKTFYSHPKPYLTLGTLLKKDKKYYISLMPRCDAARIQASDSVSFPLFPLSKGGSKDFEIIFQDRKDAKRQKIDYSPAKLTTVIFTQEEKVENSPIYATTVQEGSNEKYIFTDINGNTYEWIAELKKEKAQNISNKFAAKLARVGFNESEYLRRAYQ